MSCDQDRTDNIADGLGFGGPFGGTPFGFLGGLRYRVVYLPRESATVLDPSVAFGIGFGGGFGVTPFGIDFDEDGITPVYLRMGAAKMDVLRMIVGDTEPTLFRLVDEDDNPINIRNFVSAIRLRVVDRETGVQLFEKALSNDDTVDGNGILVPWLITDWAVEGSFWLEVRVEFSAGYQTHYRNRGKAVVEVEPEL